MGEHGGPRRVLVVAEDSTDPRFIGDTQRRDDRVADSARERGG